MADEDQNDGADLDQDDLEDLGELGGDEDGDDSEEEYTPPTKEAWDRLQRKIKRQEDRITGLVGKGPKGKKVADVDRQLQDQIRGGKGKADEDEEDDGPDPETDRWRNTAITNAAAAQISAAGFTGTAKQAARLANLIDREGIAPDRNGYIDLEDEVEELKEEYPQLFSTGGDKRRAPSVRRGDPKGTPKKDPTRATSDALLRQAGR